MFWELVTIDYQGNKPPCQLVYSSLVNLSTRPSSTVQQVANLLVNLSTRHSSTRSANRKPPCQLVTRQLFNNINKNCGL